MDPLSLTHYMTIISTADEGKKLSRNFREGCWSFFLSWSSTTKFSKVASRESYSSATHLHSPTFPHPHFGEREREKIPYLHFATAFVHSSARRVRRSAHHLSICTSACSGQGCTALLLLLQHRTQKRNLSFPSFLSNNHLSIPRIAPATHHHTSSLARQGPQTDTHTPVSIHSCSVSDR